MIQTDGWGPSLAGSDATSARGALRARGVRATVVLLGGSLLMGPSTGDIPCSLESLQYEAEREATSASIGLQRVDVDAKMGLALPHRATDQAAVCELRRLSGLTWEQIAALMGVQRRSVHFWASGKELSAQHQLLLHKVLSVVRASFRGSAAETRRALVETGSDGSNALELLERGDFEAARRRLCGVQDPQASRTRLVPGHRESPVGSPHGPATLVGALHERIHEETGPSRVPAVARAKKDT